MSFSWMARWNAALRIDITWLVGGRGISAAVGEVAELFISVVQRHVQVADMVCRRHVQVRDVICWSAADQASLFVSRANF